MSKRSTGGIALGLCFWSVVLMGIAYLLGIVFGLVGWTTPASICNQVASIVMLVGVCIGGFVYISSVGGKYRILWIVLFVIGVVCGILGVSLGNGWFHF